MLRSPCSHEPGRRRRLRLPGAAVALAVVVLAAPAAAQAPTLVVSGQVGCVDGRQVVTWTATKAQTQLSFDATIATAAMSGAATGPVAFDPATLPRLGADTTTATASVAGDATGVVTLEVAGSVTPFEGTPQPFVSAGDVTLPGGCVAPSTTATTAAPPTTAAAAAVAPSFTG